MVALFFSGNGGENFALRVSVDGHRLQIISTDGMDTEPLAVDSVILHLGERYDAVLIPRTPPFVYTLLFSRLFTQSSCVVGWFCFPVWVLPYTYTS